MVSAEVISCILELVASREELSRSSGFIWKIMYYEGDSSQNYSPM